MEREREEFLVGLTGIVLIVIGTSVLATYWPNQVIASALVVMLAFRIGGKK